MLQKTQEDLKMSLGWEVLRTPNYVKIGEEFKNIGTESLLRNDTFNKIHKTAVGESFQFTSIKQMEEVVENFSLISGYPIVGFDEFYGGSKVIAYLKSDKEQICGYDFKEFLTVIGGFDGQTSFSIGTTSILLRCQNQWSKILMHATVKNTRHHIEKRKDLMKEFETYIVNKNQLYDQIENFQNIKVDRGLALQLVEKMIFNPELPKEEQSTRALNKVSDIMISVDGEMLDLGNNGFGFFNGVTHFTTYQQKSKDVVFGNLFGTKQKMNQKAFELVANLQ